MRRAVILTIFSVFCAIAPAYAQNANICCACKGPQDTDSNSCLTVAASKLADPSSCATLPSLSPALKGWTCQTTPLGDPGSGKCRPVPQNGICKGDPQDAFAAGELKSVTQDVKNFVPNSGPAIIPNLNVQIPGFAFTGSAVTDESSSLLAQYVAGAYRYLISISAVAATIMFTFGAFMYLLGGAMPSINSGKRIMQDAVIGMLLVLGATLILRTINPDTLTLSALHIAGVNPLQIGNYQTYSPMDNVSIPGGVSGVPNIPKQAIAQGIVDGAKLVPGIDACTILAICEHETGLRPIWNGIQSGTPEANAIAFGPCQMVASYLHGQNPVTISARAQFPDFPDVGSSGQLSPQMRMQVANWLMNNPKGSGFVAALMFKSGLGLAKQNELTAVAAYGAGSGSLQKWQKANGCTPKSGQRVSDGSSASLKSDACIPHSVSIPTVGDEPKGCPEDKYECANAAPDKTAQIIGTCSNGRKCYAMITDDFVNYVIRAYPRLKSQYQCGS